VEKTTILALSWRDICAPKMGGAEVHTHEIIKRLNKDKYVVIHFSPLFDGGRKQEVIDGVHYVRRGNMVTVIWYAMMYYKKRASKIDYVLEQCNTHRFFTKFWVPHKKRIFYIHQLTREIWDINLKFPWNYIGKKMETAMLRLNRHDYTITVSESTKQDLIDVGFEAEKIYQIPNGLSEEIIRFREKNIQFDKKENTFIYVGRYARYKGINVCIEALAQVKKKHQNAKLWICGKKNEEYAENELIPLCNRLGITIADEKENPYADVVMWGFVSEEKKYELMAEAKALLFPSIREGWGIIVTEAGYMGTPSIVYDAPGARDAVNMGRAGYMCRENDAQNVAECMYRVLEDEASYLEITKAARDYAEQFMWNKNGVLFEQIIEDIRNKN
jgi:glycosyltransferase involved in cell wall biosynthesis